MNESEQIIQLIADQTAALLRNHWPDIGDCLDGGKIKISFSHELRYEGERRSVKTVIGFGRRVSDEVQESIDTASGHREEKLL